MNNPPSTAYSGKRTPCIERHIRKKIKTNRIQSSSWIDERREANIKMCLLA
jgi:hypothetical protein